MSSQRLEEVMCFLTTHGFARAASALRDDLQARSAAAISVVDAHPSPLPPLRVPSFSAGGELRDNKAAAGSPPLGSSSSSSSSDAFISLRSSRSGLLNPYGLCSPRRPRSASSSEMEFGTARDYHSSSHQGTDFGVDSEYENLDLFGDVRWYGDDLRRRSSSSTGNGSGNPFSMMLPMDNAGEDEKLTAWVEAGMDHLSRSEYGPSSSHIREQIDDAVIGAGIVKDKAMDPNSTIYGRYQIMDDHTEVLDDCVEDGIFASRSAESVDDVVLEGELLGRMEEKSLYSEKEVKIIDSSINDVSALASIDHLCKLADGKIDSSMTSTFNDDFKEPVKEGRFTQTSTNDGGADDELAGCGPVTTDAKDSGNMEGSEDEVEENIDRSLADFHKGYEVFNLRIVHRKNRTGFEENKDFPVVLNSVIAGRYYVTEYLGSAAFSKVVQAHDLHNGMDVCLKIIKNDKDFFDQSLDEIKLLKFVNKHDPSDEHHILRLYDYFYHKEHLFIVTELLRANLYEFQKYNQETGGEVYFTLPRIQAITRQCLEALVYLHNLGIIHCDLKPENILIKSYTRCEVKVIDLGSSCFVTDTLSLYVQSRSYRAPEVLLGLHYDQKIDIWSLGCILAELYTSEVLFPNEPVSLILSRIIGTIGPIEMEMLSMGQETDKYFNENYELYHKNEETNEVEILIPENFSLAHQLQCPDSKFLEFLSYLLQINPSKRPTATEALHHQWLSFSYH